MQDVLIYGATGAIGSAAARLSKSVGATITAVCDTRNANGNLIAIVKRDWVRRRRGL